MRKIKYSALLLLLCCVVGAGAQIRHEAGFSGGGGQSWLHYDINKALFEHNVHVLRNWGGEAAFSYTFMFHPNWGIGVGVGIASYSSTAVLSGSTITATRLKHGISGSTADLNYNLASTLNFYEENQNLKTANVPLFVQVQTAEATGAYLRLGGALTMPIGSPSYTIKNVDISNQAEFYDIENFRKDEIKSLSRNGTLPFNMGFMLVGEAGVKWNLTDVTSLYAGVYFNYGLFVDMYDSHKEAFISGDYISAQDVIFKTNSIIHAKNGYDGADLVGEVSPAAVGIVLRIAFGTPRETEDEEEMSAEGIPQNGGYKPSTGSSSTTQQNSTAAQNSSSATPKTIQSSRTAENYCPTTPEDDGDGVNPRPGRRLNVVTPTNATKSGESTKVQVFDASGVLIHEQWVWGEVTTVEIPYKKGVYLLQVGKQLKKIIVQ